MALKMTETKTEELVNKIKEAAPHCEERQINKVCKCISTADYGSIVRALEYTMDYIGFCESDAKRVSGEEPSIITTHADIFRKANEIMCDEWKVVADMIATEISNLEKNSAT